MRLANRLLRGAAMPGLVTVLVTGGLVAAGLAGTAPAASAATASSRPAGVLAPRC